MEHVFSLTLALLSFATKSLAKPQEGVGPSWLSPSPPWSSASLTVQERGGLDVGPGVLGEDQSLHMLGTEHSAWHTVGTQKWQSPPGKCL